MQTSDRNIEILEARLSGRTLKDVGDEFGISPARVRQIACRFVINARRFDKMEAENSRLRVVAENAMFEERKLQVNSTSGQSVDICDMDLSLRSFHCLMNGGYENSKQVAEARDYELLRIPHLGRKSLREIRLVVGGI